MMYFSLIVMFSFIMSTSFFFWRVKGKLDRGEYRIGSKVEIREWHSLDKSSLEQLKGDFGLLLDYMGLEIKQESTTYPYSLIQQGAIYRRSVEEK